MILELRLEATPRRHPDRHARGRRQTGEVFILADQSNMEGHGKVEMGRDPQAADRKATQIKGGIGSLRIPSWIPFSRSIFQ